MARTLGQNLPGCLFLAGIKVYSLRFGEVWASLEAYVRMLQSEGSEHLAEFMVAGLLFFSSKACLAG